MFAGLLKPVGVKPSGSGSAGPPGPRPLTWALPRASLLSRTAAISSSRTAASPGAVLGQAEQAWRCATRRSGFLGRPSSSRFSSASRQRQQRFRTDGNSQPRPAAAAAAAGSRRDSDCARTPPARLPVPAPPARSAPCWTLPYMLTRPRGFPPTLS